MSKCEEWLSGRRGREVHELLTRLLGECTCESMADVVELYTVAGVEAERDRQSA